MYVLDDMLWLKSYSGAVILVSHDRIFLDQVTNRTIEITNSKIYDYKASFTKYLDLRKERVEQQIAIKKNQDKEIKQTETQLRKNLAQLRMARFTLIAMGAFTVAMFFVPLERVEALSDISNLFYISGAGIVGAYMGTTAWMARK